jgi:hypothetical protein
VGTAAHLGLFTKNNKNNKTFKNKTPIFCLFTEKKTRRQLALVLLLFAINHMSYAANA